MKVLVETKKVPDGSSKVPDEVEKVPDENKKVPVKNSTWSLDEKGFKKLIKKGGSL